MQKKTKDVELAPVLTESEIKLARYSKIAKKADKMGRVIGVRRLKPSEQTRLSGMTADLTGADEVFGPNDEKISIPHRMPLMIAAAVCMIDGVHIPFPRNRAELDSIYDRLDAEGIAAASEGVVELSESDPIADPIGEAKN